MFIHVAVFSGFIMACKYFLTFDGNRLNLMADLTFFGQITSSFGRAIIARHNKLCKIWCHSILGYDTV